MENKTNNQRKWSFNEASTIQVSTHSAEWIKVYKDIEDIWSRVYDLIEGEIGKSQVDDIFDREFSPLLLKLLDVTLDGFKESVWYSFTEGKKGYL